MDKLDYHEKHDDSRFNDLKQDIYSVTNDVWALRVRNAAREGLDLDNHYDTQEKRNIRRKITEETDSRS